MAEKELEENGDFKLPKKWWRLWEWWPDVIKTPYWRVEVGTDLEVHKIERSDGPEPYIQGPWDYTEAGDLIVFVYAKNEENAGKIAAKIAGETNNPEGR